MSYLHLPRLIFSGDFQADVPTANNNVRHFDNRTFEPRFQEPQKEGSPIIDGSWNPNGGGTFRFVNCTVKQAVYLNGTIVDDPSQEAVIGQLVAGPRGNRQPSADAAREPGR